MPRKKYTYDLDQVQLTHVKSGDQDNNIYYSYFSENKEQKKKVLDALLTPHTVDDVIDMIFKGDITDDQLRKITTAITFIDAICQITGSSITVTPSKLFFATLVNWNASKGNGTNKIRSYSALHYAGESSKELDYKEYIVNGDNEGQKFNGDYISVIISPKEFGNKLELNLPIISMKLGLFRFAAEHIAAYMTIIGDPDKTSLTVPASTWMEMISEAMGKRKIATFSKLESKRLPNLVSSDAKYIDDILALNDFRSQFSFLNVYEIEFDENDGTLTLKNTSEPPEIQASGFRWVETRGQSWFLKSPRFYIVSKHGSGVHILTQG